MPQVMYHAQSGTPPLLRFFIYPPSLPSLVPLHQRGRFFAPQAPDRRFPVRRFSEASRSPVVPHFPADGSGRHFGPSQVL